MLHTAPPCVRHPQIWPRSATCHISRKVHLCTCVCGSRALLQAVRASAPSQPPLGLSSMSDAYRHPPLLIDLVNNECRASRPLKVVTHPGNPKNRACMLSELPWYIHKLQYHLLNKNRPTEPSRLFGAGCGVTCLGAGSEQSPWRPEPVIMPQKAPSKRLSTVCILSAKSNYNGEWYCRGGKLRESSARLVIRLTSPPNQRHSQVPMSMFNAAFLQAQSRHGIANRPWHGWIRHPAATRLGINVCSQHPLVLDRNNSFTFYSRHEFLLFLFIRSLTNSSQVIWSHSTEHDPKHLKSTVAFQDEMPATVNPILSSFLRNPTVLFAPEYEEYSISEAPTSPSLAVHLIMKQSVD